MKNVYVCEKCNAQFDSYDECATHERRHRELSIFPYDDDYLNSLSKYNPAAFVPDEIICATLELSDNGEKIPELYSYRLIKAEPKLTADFIKELEKREAAEKERQVKLAAAKKDMEEQLTAAGQPPEADRSYYELKRLYRTQFNIDYQY